MMLEAFLTVLDQVYLWVAMVIEMVLIALSLWYAQRYRPAWLFYLLAGVNASFFMGGVFVTLHYAIASEYPLIFSAADLSYIGMYCFLIAIDLTLVGAWSETQRQTAQKYKRVSLLGAAVVVVFHIIYIAIYPEIALNYVLYCIPLAFLGYHALLMALVSRETRNEKLSLYGYHKTVLLFLAVELLMFLSSSIGIWPLTSALWIVLEVPIIRLTITARKGVEA